MQESRAGCPGGRPQLPGAVTQGMVVSLLRGPVACWCCGISLPGRETGNAPAWNPRPVQEPPGSGAVGETTGGASTYAPSDDTCPPAETPGGQSPQGHLGSRGPGQGRPVHPPGGPALLLGLTPVPHTQSSSVWGERMDGWTDGRVPQSRHPESGARGLPGRATSKLSPRPR